MLKFDAINTAYSYYTLHTRLHAEYNSELVNSQ